MTNTELTVHTDGGSRGNPGMAASAFVVERDGIEIHRQSKFLGIATNNFAEYSGVIIALEWLASPPICYSLSPITFFLDSELVVKQINGIYRVKEPSIQKLYTNVLQLLGNIKQEVCFKNVRREQNKLADRLVNEELDKH